MLFNSFEFLVFLPIVFILYWFISHQRQWQNMLIVLASYVFYGWWDWRFLILILFTTLCSFASGLLIEHYRGHRKKQRIVSASNIVLNLTFLCVFKYYNFFVDSIDSLLRALFGYQLDWVTLDIILPVGISFYTFQALSYSIDVYRNNIKATHDVVEFSAYISFFPQLVAGPIERATNLLPQFQQKRQFDYSKAVDGLRQMLWGFFKKLVVADNCASIVNAYWNQHQGLPGLFLLLLGVFFSFQIYCDFSGYSDIAIGCARLFGFNLMRNFNYPYFSRSIPEFWRRWHISLMTWFRDYVYFPLGGSRCSKWKVIRNIFIVWAISGLWHGANWTFICWGLYHATLLTFYNIFKLATKHNNVASGHNMPNIKEFIQISLTFFFAVFGWIVFRSENMTEAVSFFSAIVTNSFFEANTVFKYDLPIICITLFLSLLLLAIEWLQRDKQHALQFPFISLLSKRPIRWAIYIVLTLIMYLFSGQSQTFIYFQF